MIKVLSTLGRRKRLFDFFEKIEYNNVLFKRGASKI